MYNLSSDTFPCSYYHPNHITSYQEHFDGFLTDLFFLIYNTSEWINVYS